VASRAGGGLVHLIHSFMQLTHLIPFVL
jgi:hypothetical protein